MKPYLVRKSFSHLSSFLLLCCSLSSSVTQLSGCVSRHTHATQKRYSFRPHKKDLLAISPQSSRYLTRIVERIIRYGVQNMALTPSFHLLKTRARIALSTPDYRVYIGQGLIQSVENESQLAFIIAHELCHFEAGHFLDHSLNTREQELAADTCAVQALLKAQYSVSSLPSLFPLVYSQNDDREEMKARLTNLQTAIRREKQSRWPKERRHHFTRFRHSVMQTLNNTM